MWCVSLLSIFELIDQFHKILYECYAIGGHPNLVFSNFLQSVITAWQMHKLLRWECHLIDS